MCMEEKMRGSKSGDKRVVRRLDLGRVVTTDVTLAEIVGENEDDVGFDWFRG